LHISATILGGGLYGYCLPFWCAPLGHFFACWFNSFAGKALGFSIVLVSCFAGSLRSFLQSVFVQEKEEPQENIRHLRLKKP
jgi:hypothetical protein